MDDPEIALCAVELRPGAQHGRTQVRGLQGTHHFCFATYQRLDRLEWGGLRALHQYRLAAGGRREPTFHAGFEILTLVTAGALRRTGTFIPRPLLVPGSIELVSTGVGAHLGLEAAGDGPAEYVEIWLASDQPGIGAARQWRPVLPWKREQVLAAAPPAGDSLALAAAKAEVLRVSLGKDDAFVRELSPETCAYLAVTQGQLEIAEARAASGDAFAISGPGTLLVNGHASFLYVATSTNRPAK